MNQAITNLTAMLDIGVPILAAALLHYFYFRLKKNYLQEWSVFWVGIAFFKFAVWLRTEVLETAGILGDLVWWLAAAALIFACVQLACGTFSAIRLRPLRPDARRRLYWIAAAALVAVVLLLFPGEAKPGSHLVRFNYFSGIALGAVYLGCAVALWKPRRHGSGSWLLLAAIMMVAGAVEISGPLIAPAWAADLKSPRLVLEIVLNMALAAAMVIRLLDEERVAALSAADHVAHMVYHEELTGLANRSLLIDRLLVSLSQAERRDSSLALVFLDIDGFKPVNDTLGHDTGDELLKGVADRIRSIVRAEDTVARFGGDEFVILIPELRSAEDSGRIGSKLVDAIRQPFRAGDHEVSVTTSVGIALYPHDGRDADTLMRNADKAMYQAKEKGGNQFQIYSVSMNHRALEKMEMEMSLRRALEFRQMELHFQPIIEGSAMSLVGFESLLYWDHPVRGLLAAKEFMPDAEQVGLLSQIGRFTISESCRQLSNWQKKVGTACFVAINVSSSQLREDDVLSDLEMNIHEYQLDPGRIELEIIETSASPDLELQSVVVPRFRELGIRITIDDFGNRFASLGQLRGTPADAVKLSPALTADIDDPTNAVITAGVISIAHGLKLEVACEGIRNNRQLEVLSQQGCDRFQGPLFGDPVPAQDVPELIRRHEQGRNADV